MREPHFCIIWTSKKLLARIGEELTQDDATYRLTWQGYPFFVSGRSHPCGKFFPTHVTLASHEDSRACACSYRFVQDKVTPRYVFKDIHISYGPKCFFSWVFYVYAAYADSNITESTFIHKKYNFPRNALLACKTTLWAVGTDFFS